MNVDGQLHMKVDKKLLEEFKTKCNIIGRNHHTMLREIMQALVDGRLTIKPNQHQKDLYE